MGKIRKNIARHRTGKNSSKGKYHFPIPCVSCSTNFKAIEKLQWPSIKKIISFERSKIETNFKKVKVTDFHHESNELCFTILLPVFYEIHGNLSEIGLKFSFTWKIIQSRFQYTPLLLIWKKKLTNFSICLETAT